MREEADLIQWQELYYITDKLKELSPWEYLSELDLITIILPNVEEPYYCSIMGSSGDPFGVAIYKGYQAIQGFFKVARSEKIPESQLIRYEDCLVVYFGDKNNLFNEEIEVMKKIGKRTKDDNWTFFRSVKKAYAPYMFNKEEVEESTKVIKELVNAIIDYNNLGKIEFELGNTLLRSFNDEKQLWETTTAPIFLGDIVYENVIFNDKEILDMLRDKNRINSNLELDIVYLESVIEDKKFDKPIIPRLCLLADRDSGYILDQEMLTPSNDDIQEILKSIINYTRVIGRPKSLYVRDEYTKSVLRHLCKKLDIELKVKEKLIVIDSICSELFADVY